MSERFKDKFPIFNENVMNGVEVFVQIGGVLHEKSYILNKPDEDATSVILKSVGKIMNERTEIEEEVTWVTEIPVEDLQAIVTKQW